MTHTVKSEELNVEQMIFGEKYDFTLPLGYSLRVGLLFFLSLWINPICGQEYDFQHLDENDGLKHAIYDFIKKDSRGFLWIGSMEGLIRFDGLRILPYSNDSLGNVNTNGENVQSELFEDSKGNLWYATFTRINCYHRKSGAFSSFQLKDETGKFFTEGYSLLHLENDSTLWIKAKDNIFRYDLSSEKSQKIVSGISGMRFSVDTFSNGNVKRVYSCPRLNTTGIEVVSMDPVSKQWKLYSYLKEGVANFPDMPLHISMALIQNDTTVWLLSDLGLLAFNPRKPNRKVSSFTLTSNAPVKLIDGAFFENKYLFLSSISKGILLFDLIDQQFITSYTSSEGQPGSLSSNTFSEVFIDQENHLWTSNIYNGGIDHTWIKPNKFHFPFPEWNEQKVMVSSLTEDKNRRIWCATLDQGVFVMNQKLELIKNLPYHDGQSGETTGISPISTLNRDRNGSIWALSANEIYIYQDNQFRSVFSSKNNNFYQLLHFFPNTKILTTNEGVLQVEWEAGKGRLRVKDTVSTERFFLAFKGNKNSFYCSFREQELWVFKKNDEGKFKILKKTDLGKGVYSVFEDLSNNTAWIGTTAGLKLLDLKNYRLSDPPQNKTDLGKLKINGILKDDKKDYWYATENGLYTWNSKKKELYHYHSEDGMITPQFNPKAQLQDFSGRILFGARNGLTAFYPDSVRPYPHGPQIQIESLLVNGEPYKSENFIGENKEFELRYNENNLEFRVLGLNSFFPEKNIIHYQLKGHRNDWKSMENGGTASFFKIRPGNYTLNIYAQNANGLSGKTYTYPITITPPIWHSIWFWGLAGILFLLVIWRFSSWYAARQLKQQQEKHEQEMALQKALQNERNRIAADMHDDLGGGLTSIRLLLEKLKRNNMPQKDTIPILRRVDTHATTLIENMREIVWATNSSYDNLPDLIAYIRSYVVEFFDEKDISCHASTPREIPELMVSGKKRRNIFYSVKEAVNNIAKHAGASEVSFSIQLRDDKIKIDIKDNGKGIDLSQNDHRGNGLRNMRKRMEDIDGSWDIQSDEGTHVTLELPMNLSPTTT